MRRPLLRWKISPLPLSSALLPGLVSLRPPSGARVGNPDLSCDTPDYPSPTSCDTLRAVRTDGGSKKTVDDMEGLSMQTCNIKEEWMDLEDLDFDVVDVFNNNNSDKGFQRQQSFLDILTDLTDYKDEEQGIDRAETAINSDSTFINNASSLTGYSYYSPPSPSDSCFSTEGFPEEIHQIDQLLPFELPFERVNQLDEQVATSIDLEVTNKTEEGSEEEMEEQSYSDEDSVPEEYSILKMKSGVSP